MQRVADCILKVQSVRDDALVLSAQQCYNGHGLKKQIC